MSDVAQVALITGGIGFLSLMATLGFNLWSSSRERRHRLAEREQDYGEWYRRTLFEKRLVAVQEAYKWLMRFNVAMNNADPDQPDCDANADLRRICDEARKWYDENVLYIYDGLPGQSSFVGLINAAYAHACGRAHADHWKMFIEAESLIKGRAGRLLEVERAASRNSD
jgi:hypothetical protein